MTAASTGRTYALLVGDGMADLPIPQLDNKTPLEYARTPNMDRIAALGRVGRVLTVPDGLAPGSDVANMSLLGYDPAAFYSGRAPIEAASLGIPLAPGDTAFRCNLVTLRDGLMDDYSAGHIETEDARAIIEELQGVLASDRVRLHPGVSYRHLLVIRDLEEGRLDCTPPHDISGRPFEPHLPKGAGAALVCNLMERAREALRASPTNAKRRASGKKPATDIWLWGQGRSIALPTLAERYGLSGSVISAVDLVRGLGVLGGMKVRRVQGATGYLGTNYAGKVSAAREALSSENFVFLHVEAPDETSHEGSLEKKIQAIEEFDANVVGEMLRLLADMPGLRIMVAPDHATPVSTKTHHSMPVPFAVCGEGVNAGDALTYCERSAEHATRLHTGASLFNEFIRGDFC
jgi:2,3-bisphosphoglycerate-independent phosphoglycerate mutase